jgi:ceroid-lipofuscinosis protein 8
MFWNLAIVRGSYGLVGTLLSIYVVKFGHFESMAVSTTKESTFLCLAHFGFFVFEWSAQIIFDIKFATFSQALHLHHFMAITGFWLANFYETNHFICLFAFILEASTPFSCLCYCLLKARLENTLLWRVNQMALVHVFHIRSVIECVAIYLMIDRWDEFQKIPQIFYWHTFISISIVMVFLTPLWTYRKTKQLFEPADWNTSEETKQKNKKA